jgi:uncharacterized membrane protein YgcG
VTVGSHTASRLRPQRFKGEIQGMVMRAARTLGAPIALCLVACALAFAAAPAILAVDPGPPFPDPEIDRAVYDYAGVFSDDTITSAEATIDVIENRTGAEVVVYTQDLGFRTTIEDAEEHARALMDQWGIGRKGFDDGLVILFDLDSSLEHGQVQLYAGPGYAAAFLSNSERQQIFENDMTPRLAEGNLDDALLIALQKIDANATPEHAATLERARQIDAVVGLVGAPVIFLVLTGWALWSWLRFGRDPVYLDDPSIHMPAPPPNLTAASGAVVVSGGSSRRALTTALLDLASRGKLSFREQKTGFLGHTRKVGIETEPSPADEVTEARRALNDRRPISSAEEYALDRLRSLASTDGYIEPDDMLKFGEHVSTFDERIENHVTRQGWFTERPSKSTTRWVLRATAALIAGIVGIVVGFNLPSNGLLFLGGAAVAAAAIMFIVARSMPSVTMPGAMIRAMLAAYRRTLEKTMAQARSMQQVVDEARLPWLETPDQAVVWGVALGLQAQVEDVLGRTMDDLKEGTATTGSYLPVWYHGGDGSGGGGGGGLFSSSALPNFGGMMAALGTIGNSPSSSGSGGGFGGGGSGGGGGGAGGGF